MNALEGRRSALVVAVSEYKDPKLGQLRSPSRDAEELARVLGDPAVGGYEVVTSLNEIEPVVSEKLEGFLADRDRDELLLLHLSCHGVKNASGELFFAAADTRLDRLKSTSISSSWVVDLMRDSRAKRIVLFLDCCYSGAFSRSFRARSADPNVHVLERFAGTGLAVLTASGATEYAFEDNELTTSDPQPSFFTTALVQGLETGEADRDRDGFISFDDLYNYVYDEVRRRTEDQTPTMSIPTMEGRLFIARSRRGAALPAALLEALENSLADVRLVAVTELSALVGSSQPTLAAAARAALERRAHEDDSAKVRAAARTALGEPDHGEPFDPPPPVVPVVPVVPVEPVPVEPVIPVDPDPWWARLRWSRRRSLAAAAGAGVLAVVILLLVTGGGGGGIDWQVAGPADASLFGGNGLQQVSAVAATGGEEPQAVAVGDEARTLAAAWGLDGESWERMPDELFGGAFRALVLARSPQEGVLAVAGGRSGEEVGPTQGAALWVLDSDGWHGACGDACGDLAAPDKGAGPRAQEVLAIVELGAEPGTFVAVGADQRADDGLYDGAVWRLAGAGPAERIALEEGTLGGPLQQQLRGIADTPSGLVAVGQNGRDAGVWQSTDGGESWTRLTHPSLVAELGRRLLPNAVVAHGDDVVVVGSESDQSGENRRGVVWVLRNGTGAWSRGSSEDFQYRGQELLGVTVTPSGLLVAVGHDRAGGVSRAAVWSSVDGRSWTRRDGVPDEEQSTGMIDVAVVGDELVAVGVSGSASKSDGRIWTAPAP